MVIEKLGRTMVKVELDDKSLGGRIYHTGGDGSLMGASPVSACSVSYFIYVSTEKLDSDCFSGGCSHDNSKVESLVLILKYLFLFDFK